MRVVERAMLDSGDGGLGEARSFRIAPGRRVLQVKGIFAVQMKKHCQPESTLR